MKKLIRELKRRNVFNVAGSYAVIAWIIIQVVVTIKDPLGLPDWADSLIIVALLLGFPVCVLIAWYFDYTGQGIEITGTPESDLARQSLTLRDRVTMIFSVIAVALLLVTSGYFMADGGRNGPVNLAILPFSTAADEDLQYLGDGIRDSLVIRLSRLQDLHIKTAGSGQAVTGAMLGVDYICTGQVTQRGDALVIVAELVEVEGGAILWREQFSTAATSLLEIEAGIASNMARQLELRLSDTDTAELARTSTANPAAHRLYMQGRYFWNRRTADGFENSLHYYQEAMALDPNYALAHAGLSQTYLMQLGWGLQPPQEVAQQIVEQAELAIRLDPTLAEPHAALGYYHTIHTLDWEQARREFLRAIELNSNYSSAHHWYALLLKTLGDIDAAIEEMLLARELEPLSPIINAEAGLAYFYKRDYQQAIKVLEAALSLDSNFLSTVQYLARTHVGLGQLDRARDYVEQWRALSPDNEFLGISGAMLLPSLGMEEEGWRIYRDAVAESEERYIMPGLLGITAAALGDFDAADAYINTAIDEGSMVLSWLRNPLLDEFRTDSRYTEIMNRVGLVP